MKKDHTGEKRRFIYKDTLHSFLSSPRILWIIIISKTYDAHIRAAESLVNWQKSWRESKVVLSSGIDYGRF